MIYLAIIFIRTLVLYFVLLLSMRLMGKRQLGQMEISEFLVAAMVADLAATPLQDIGIPLLNGIVPIITLFCLEVLIAGLSLKSTRMRKIVFGKPSIIIEKGVISSKEMHRNRFTIDELMQELRTQGINELQGIEYAILETNGNLNIILHQDSQPVTPKQLNLQVEEKGYPHIIINDGILLENNLSLLGRDKKWLKRRLSEQGIKNAEDVYLFTLSETGDIYCQRKDTK